MKKIMKTILFYIITAALLLTACAQAAPAQPAGSTSTGNAANPTTIPVEVTIAAGTPAPAANHEHLAQLKKGIESWNAWRRDNKDIVPDLTSANLKKLDLSRINFSKTILVGANLQDVVLIKADLRFANLTNANLANADLTDANLRKAILTGAHYNSATKWPTGFDPVAAGATLVP